MAEYDTFSEILNTYGAPADGERMSSQQTASYRHIVPDGLCKFWQDYGLGSFKDGRFRLSDPDVMKPVSNAVFSGDPMFLPDDIVIIGYTGFGDLLCWHPNLRTVTVDVNDFRVANPGNPNASRLPGLEDVRVSDDFEIGHQIENYLKYDDFTTVFDAEGEELFPLAMQRLGSLAPGEIYGFVPALNFGGEPKIENVRRLGVIEHLLFLAQLGPFTLTALTPQRPGFPYGELVALRRIGPQGGP